MNYGTFWQRFAAMWIDFFVLLPLMFLYDWFWGYSKWVTLLLLIPYFFTFVAYHVYCHARFGQTVGKKVMGIRVVAVNGAQIGWRKAWLRSSVDMAFAILSCFQTAYLLIRVPESDYSSTWSGDITLLSDSTAYYGWLDVAAMIWVWSEVIVMLFNEKRRALHDFIAGTVVISERAAAAPPMLTVNRVEPGV